MKKGAGILLYKFNSKKIEILFVHPGGPFWKNKDEGAWSIPKGEFLEEDPLEAALREFEEETGSKLKGEFLALTPLKQKSGKQIYAWAVEGDLDIRKINSNLFEMEWPPKSAKLQLFPEIDKGEWFTANLAKRKINTGQAAFISELETMLLKKN